MLTFTLGQPAAGAKNRIVEGAVKVAQRVFTFNFKTRPAANSFVKHLRDNLLPFTLTAEQPGFWHIAFDSGWYLIAGPILEAGLPDAAEALQHAGGNPFQKLDNFLYLGLNQVPDLVSKIFNDSIDASLTYTSDFPPDDTGVTISIAFDLPPVWFADP